MQSIVRRIFGDRKLPEGLSEDAYDKFMHDNFPKWVTEFESNGFLEQTKLPPIADEDALMDVLMKYPNDLVVVKYWKHGCIPCLSFAEMYKSAQMKCLAENKRIRWFSVDTKASDGARELVDFQLVDGTPTIQTFAGCKQIGNEIRATQLDDLMGILEQRLASVPNV
ncbi:thioredoxin-like protein, putative [Bodo saltans]|uniref:Thioredoxin-like protein, putative n=1 Tax=Bodo saltans TaxID=75058 RepID=A0A0S4JAW9_BODSA|nr:thioredoxin-like protein, putative [Bodo saltans]|eukprot:CUG87152.1 thioredoxin-like protein, putative [Bodo saltans]